ncbi:MAG: glycosyl transferase family 1, partial [Acidobacteriota bacterium]
STNEIANAAKVPVGYQEPGELEDWARRFSAANSGRREEIEMLALFCALIRRRVFAEVGPLDERFAVGMFEDDDYSRRLRESGYGLAVARDAFVHHWGRGSFRALGEGEYRRIFQENRRRFDEKWGRSPRT